MQYEGSEHVTFTRPAPSIMPTDMAKRCSNCNSDLSADDLDLKSVAEYFNQEEAQRYWEEGAANGCLFCRLIAAVWADAGQQYRCYRSGYVKIGQATNGQYFLRLVNILSKLPHTVDRGVYATIAIYLEGKASPFDRYVSQTNTADSGLPILLERYKPIPRQAIDPACLSLAKQWFSPDCFSILDLEINLETSRCQHSSMPGWLHYGRLFSHVVPSSMPSSYRNRDNYGHLQ